jgi:hypothetical protein
MFNKKEYMKNWYIDNKKSILENAKKYYQDNKEKILKLDKRYYKKNKKLIGIKSKQYRKINKEKIKNTLYTPLYIYFRTKGNANFRKIEFNISKEDFISWYIKQKQECYYCKRTLEKIKNDNREGKRFNMRFSIERTNNEKGYFLNNIKLVCFRCNQTKSNFFTEQEMLEIGKIINRS